MVSLYGILNIGIRGVSAAQAGINTTGQNIANANTEGYTRQRVDQQAVNPLVTPQGAFGMGVEIVSIERIRDKFIESQIRDAHSDTSFNQQLDNIYLQIETIINDPLSPISDSLDDASSSGINNLLSRFFRSMNDLSLNPEAPEVRSAAIESGLSLAQTFNQVGDQMRTLREELNDQASRLVDEVNRMTTEIANLNRRISVSEVGGTVNANDLRDKRDLLLSQLSEVIPITTEEQPGGAIDVNLAGERIVDGVNNREILKESTESNDDLEIFRLRIGETGLDVMDDLITAGELGAVLQARDRIVPFFRNEIDTLARGVIYEINKIHSASAGLDGYAQVESHFRIPDGSTPADTRQTLDSIFNNPTLLSDTPLSDVPFGVQDGSFTIRVADEDNKTRDAYNLNVKTSDSLFEIAERIDRSDGIVSSVRSALTFEPVFVERTKATIGATAAEIAANTGIGALAAAAGTPISETPGNYTMLIDVRDTGGGLLDLDPTTPDIDPVTVTFDDTMTLNQLANAIQSASNQTVRAVVVPSDEDPTISVLQLSAINQSDSFSVRNDASGIMKAFDFPVTDPSIPLAGGVADRAVGQFFGRSDTSFLGGGNPAFSPAFPGPPPSVVREGSFELVVLDTNNVPTISTITVQAGTVETIDDVIASIQAADPNLTATVNTNNELVITSSNNRQFFFQNDQTGLIEALGLKDINGFGQIGEQPFRDGSFEIVVANKSGTITHIVEVPITANPSTVGGVLTMQGVIDQINAATGGVNAPILASIDRDPKDETRDLIKIEAIGDFEFTFRSDDSLILSALGFTAGPVLDPTGDNPIQGAEFPVALGDNIGALVRAEIVDGNQLTISTSEDERISFTNDDSYFLAAAGINGLFQGSDSRSMRVNKELIEDNNLLATSKSGLPGDNSAAAQMAQLESRRVLDGRTINEFYRTTISTLGIESSRATQFSETNNSILRELENFQEQKSGVSLDEESVNIIRFQQAFQASARVIQAVDEMINIVINQIGR